MSAMPASGVMHFGHRPDSLWNGFDYGLCDAQTPTVPDGRRRRVSLLLQGRSEKNNRIQTLVIGWVGFGLNGYQEAAEVNLDEAVGLGMLPDDGRVLAFVSRYSAKFPHLGCVDAQRSCPLELPFFGGTILRPGDVEVI